MSNSNSNSHESRFQQSIKVGDDIYVFRADSIEEYHALVGDFVSSLEEVTTATNKIKQGLVAAQVASGSRGGGQRQSQRSRQSSDTAPQEAEQRTYLDVPFAEKDAAKAAGARWDGRKKQWYVVGPPDERHAEWVELPF